MAEEAGGRRKRRRGPVVGARFRQLSTPLQIAVGCFAVVGVAAFVVGGHDIFLATQLSTRLLAAVVLLIALGLLVSSIGFLRSRPWAYTLGVLSSVGSAIAATLFFAAQWVNRVHDARLGLWAALSVFFALTALGLAKQGRVHLATLAKRRVQVVSSVLSIGAVVSIAQFWNAAIRVPPAAAPSLTISTDLTEIGQRDGMRRFAGTIKVTNTATTKVWILTSLYNVLGGRADLEQKKPPQFEAELESHISQEAFTYGLARHTTKRYDQVLETGQLLGHLTYLVPDEEYTFNLALYTPIKRYDLLRLETFVVVAKDTLVLDEIRQPRPEIVSEDGMRRVVAARPVRDTSWFGRIFRGDRVVHTEVVFDRTFGYLYPYLSVYINRGGREPVGAEESAYALRMRRSYGVATSDGSFEMPVK
jgi:hypothetical protein